MDSLLSIKDLKVHVNTARGVVHAVRGVSLDLKPGEIHGLVGESGCGKTMTAKSILRLHDETKSLYSGEILYNNRDILSLNKKELSRIRGKDISIIFQDPSVSLNPVLTVGGQIAEMLKSHLKLNKKQAYEKTLSLLETVGIHPAESRYRQYPYQFSGGMLQRIMIAMAISCNPKLLLADEPTTALDVTIQAQTLELIKELQAKTGMTVLFITHNFSVVAEICDRVSVMYAGKIVETGNVTEIFKNPRHPYTKLLLDSIPKSGRQEKRLATIPGSPPELFQPIKGCAFAKRCPCASALCKSREPETVSCGELHQAACHLLSAGDIQRKSAHIA